MEGMFDCVGESVVGTEVGLRANLLGLGVTGMATDGLALFCSCDGCSVSRTIGDITGFIVGVTIGGVGDVGTTGAVDDVGATGAAGGVGVTGTFGDVGATGEVGGVGTTGETGGLPVEGDTVMKGGAGSEVEGPASTTLTTDLIPFSDPIFLSA